MPQIDSIWFLGYKTIAITTVVFLGLLTYYGMQRGLGALSLRGMLPNSIRLGILVLLRWLTFVCVFLLCLQQLGVPLSAVWAAFSAVVMLVAIGFIAVWSVLSNILCSILLVITAPFHIGDEIEITEAVGGDGLRGTVRDINMLYTILDSNKSDQPEGDPRSCTIRVPNNIFFQKAIKCFRNETSISLREYFAKKK